MRRVLWVAGGMCAGPLLALGCRQVLSLDTDDTLLVDGGSIDAEAGSPDAGLVCPPGKKNCDGTCVPTDRIEYGCASDSCAPCGAPFARTMRCDNGACRVATCRDGRDDCNGRVEDGCEADLLTAETCGSCTRSCPSSFPLCGQQGVTITCLAACEGGQPPCGTSCVDTQTAIAHCGKCGAACPSAANADPKCSAGKCGVECRSGYGDCDGNPTNGCEPEKVFYKDGDGDGFGATEQIATGCTKPAGYAAVGGDCSDTTPTAYPGQTGFFGVGYAVAGGATSYDYDCDGKETEAPGFAHLPECNVCDGRSGYRPQLRSGPGVEPYCGATAKITCGGSGSTSGSGSCAVMSSGSAIPCR
ncbi:MAG: hypothetical protein JNL38_40905 [Myxococcales bacterium]|jgi:hypothetical protein|nr:hypothetical protein [Myxococcales bacterium]